MIAWIRTRSMVVGIVALLAHLLSTAAHASAEIVKPEPSIVHAALLTIDPGTQHEESAPANGHCHACAVMGMTTPAPSAAFGRSAHRVNWPFLESSTASLATRVEPPPPRRFL